MDILVVNLLSDRLSLALKIEQKGQVVCEHDHLSMSRFLHQTLCNTRPILVIE